MNQRYQLLEPRGNRNGNVNALGEGAYGVVYKALDRATQKFVALKKIRVETECDGISPSTLREITLLMQINHENVVKLENVVMDKERMSLIFELVDSDLKKYLDQMSSPLPNETVKLLSGLAHCHSMGVMHRDLKPHNILISVQGKLKIADFGLARTFTPFNRALTTEVITRWYRAPEILLGFSKYSASVDLWSVGCIMAEMSNNQALLMGDSDIDQLYKIFRLNGTPTALDWPEIENLPYYRSNFPKWYPVKLSLVVPNLPPLGLDLLQKLFDYDPFRRLSAKAALLHPFLLPEHAVVGNATASPSQTRPENSELAPLQSVHVHKVTPDGGNDRPPELEKATEGLNQVLQQFEKSKVGRKRKTSVKSSGTEAVKEVIKRAKTAPQTVEK